MAAAANATQAESDTRLRTAQAEAQKLKAEERANALQVELERAQLGLHELRTAMQAAVELAAQQLASIEAEAKVMEPPKQPDWEHLCALKSAEVRLSQVRSADVRYLSTQVFGRREWRAADITAAMVATDHVSGGTLLEAVFDDNKVR